MATSKINKKQLSEEVKTAGLFMIGMIGGAQISRALQKRTGVGELLDGLDGFSKQMIAPAITFAAGTAMGVFLPKKELRTVGFGMAAMGGALTANAMGAKVLPTPSAPLPAPSVKGLGYTMDALPDPSVFGLDGDPSFIDANGNVFDASGNLVNGLGAYRDSDGNLYDDDGNPINGVGDAAYDDAVYDADGNLLMGYTEGEGEIGGDGNLPGIGDVGDFEDGGIPGIGDVGDFEDGGIPGIGSLDDYGDSIPGVGSPDFDLDEDDGIDGLGDFDEEYNMLTGTDGMSAYELEL